MAATDRQILDLIRSSLGYKTTVGPTDKQKVEKALAGQVSVKPSSALGQAAWHLARRLAPAPVPPPPPPPPRRVAPQTYNRGSAGQDARYCTFGLPTDSQGRPVDDYSTYDENGLSLGGRTGNPVPGLKPADEMDGRGPCEPYGPFPPWPTMSYDR